METIYLVRDKSNFNEDNWTTKCFKTPEDVWSYMKQHYSAPIEDENGEKIKKEDFANHFTVVGKPVNFSQTISGWDDDNEIVCCTFVYEVTLIEVK